MAESNIKTLGFHNHQRILKIKYVNIIIVHQNHHCHR